MRAALLGGGASIGSLFASGRAEAVRRTGERCWRGSFDIEDKRAQVARPLGDGTEEGAKRFMRAWLIACEDYAEHIKQRGRSHELTANVVKLLGKIMWRCMDRKTGRCEVPLDRIMEVSGFSRPTTVRLLSVARRFGFVDWVRRTEKTGNDAGAGPRVRQTANAYFFEISRLPKEALRRLRQLLPDRMLRAWPERVGSGPVPNALVRQVRRLANSLGVDARRGRCTNRAGPQEIRLLDERLESLPREQWPAVLFPGDPAAQAWFAAETGIAPQGQSASSEPATDSPP